MKAGRVAGVQLKLNNWFLVLLGIFYWAGMHFKVTAVFFCVLLHEMAHVFMAKIFGFTIQQIELLPFGGVAIIDKLHTASPKEELLIVAAGPAMSFIGALIFNQVAGLMPEYQEALAFFSKVNLTLALFNLLPALPLDGGRILRRIAARYLGYSQATKITIGISRVISIIIIIFIVLDYINTKVLNITLVVIAVFVFAAAKAESKLAGFHTVRIINHKKEKIAEGKVLATIGFVAQKDTKVCDIVSNFAESDYGIILVLDSEYKLCGTITETELWEGVCQKGYYAKLGEFL